MQLLNKTQYKTAMTSSFQVFLRFSHLDYSAVNVKGCLD